MPLMQIGLDTVAMKKELYGIGNYIKNLVFALLSTAPEDDYLLVTSRGNREHFAPLGKNVSFESCPASRPLRICWEQAVLPRILKARNVDLFHGLASVLPLRTSCRCVATVHDLTTFLAPERHTAARRTYLRWMIPRACRRADAIIAVSESTRDDLVKFLRVPPGKISVIHLGVAESFRPVEDADTLLQVRRKYGLPEKFILYLGLVEPRKNLGTLVAAYREAEEVNREFSLVLAGSLGWDYQPLIRQIRSSAAGDRILLPGYIRAEDLPAVYSASSLFVYPSLYEGFGLPVLEAMACGTPVITSNVSSLPEVAGEAALLVDPRSPHELAAAMRKLLANEDVRKSFSERGLVRARSFSWSQTARKTLEVYAQLAG
jgi:glycosyltransferase involved in cell wall biosynthesis